MYPIWIAWAGRKRIDQEQMDAVFEQLARLVHESLKAVAAGLVARRHDFDHGHDAVAADMPDGERALLAAIILEREHIGPKPGRDLFGLRRDFRVPTELHTAVA